MLRYIKIKNFALIRSYEIEWGKGLNVLSGETGAGKSIILNAISFALGARSDKQNIRNGESELRVEIAFDDLKEKTLKVLDDLGVERCDYLIVVRTLNIDGKSEIRANGGLITQTMLKTITSTLVDIYGQFDLYSLLNVKEHLNILDSIAGDLVIEPKQEISELLAKRKDIDERLSECYSEPGERARVLELLNYQVDEIERANLKDGEEDDLKSQKEKMLSVEKIASNLNKLTLIADEYADIGLLGLLRECTHALETISDIDVEYQDLYERLNSASLEIEDIVDTSRSLADGLYYNQDELESIEARLDLYASLRKKYGADLHSINEYHKNALVKIDEIVNNEKIIERLQADRAVIDIQLKSACQKLTDIRKRVATQMEQGILKELADLNMKGASFKINFEEREPNNSGQDEVEFLFSANVGEPLKSLAKVISGGELSRFMLAYKNVVAVKDAISTLIFDEIDAGISGDVGSKVANKLANISKNNQVIVISHLPQIVAMGDNNYLIKKYVDDGQTITSIDKIDEAGVIEELIRLSGLKDSESSLIYAKDLRNRASQLKKE